MVKNSNESSETPKHYMKGGDFEQSKTPSKYATMEPVELKPLEVKVYNNNFDKALRAFRALVQKERILSAYKERQTYEKPSDKKRRKRNERKRKLLEVGDKTFMKRGPRPQKTSDTE